MATASSDPQVAQLLALVDEAFDRRSWHGTNLRGALRGLTPAQAVWRPDPVRLNVWELTAHAAYWKYAVRRRLTGEKRGRFPLRGSNFFPVPAPVSAAAWRNTVALLRDEHDRLRQTVASLRDAVLATPVGKGRDTVGGLIRGVAAHDLYHAGQIQLLKRLMP
jgi:hypothetical protein